MSERAFTRTNYLALPDRTDLPARTSESSPSTLGVTWQALVDTFLSDYRGATQRSYRDAFNRFAMFCDVDMQAIVTRVPDEDAVKAYRDSLLDLSLIHI